MFHLPVPKINSIYGPWVGDVSDITLIRTGITFDLGLRSDSASMLASKGVNFSNICTRCDTNKYTRHSKNMLF